MRDLGVEHVRVATVTTTPERVGQMLAALKRITVIGVALFGKINDRQFRYAILVLLLISGCLMMRSW